jgi:hypothetical protein
MKIRELLSEDVEGDLQANVKDALMFLKIVGSAKVPTQTVMREFQKRGLDISLEQLQQMFPQGNEFLKNINNGFVEFNTNQPEAPKSFKQKQDSKTAVKDMALRSVRRRD